MASGGTIIGIVVVAILALIFLPRVMPQLQAALKQGGSFLGGANGISGGGNGLSGVGNGQSGANGMSYAGANGGSNNGISGSNYNYSSTTCKNGDCNISVRGNGCACANGQCRGNCSDMEQFDLENFSPLEWIEQHT